MRIDEFEFRNKQGEEIEPTKDQLVIYIKSLHKKVADLETKLADMEQEQIKEMKEHQEAMGLADKTITNLVEDNRASQEWYKKQLADTEEQNKRVLEKLELIVSANQELEQKLAESESKLRVSNGVVASLKLEYSELEEDYDKQENLLSQILTENSKLQFENDQLKQQFAEKECEADQRYKDWQEEIRECDGLRIVLSEVRKQFADKEKEILNLKNIVDGIDTLKQYDKDAKQIILINPDNVYADGHKLVIKQADQDQISFAVEQLEQLKHDIWTDQQDDGWLDEQVDIYFLTETIDNQIKRLTHQHEDKGE